MKITIDMASLCSLETEEFDEERLLTLLEIVRSARYNAIFDQDTRGFARILDIYFTDLAQDNFKINLS
jgi:hypothetical protein